MADVLPSEKEVIQSRTEDLQQVFLSRALGDRILELERDLKSAESNAKVRNDQIVRLEAENVRLKMTRTDKELSAQVDGLRAEVGKKDRENVDLKKTISTYRENEAIILRRASAAEQKIVLIQNTMTTIQRARDAAHLEVEKHERERLDAVRDMISYSDRVKKLEARSKVIEPVVEAVLKVPMAVVKASRDLQVLVALAKKTTVAK